MKFATIEKYPHINYSVAMHWRGLTKLIDEYVNEYELQLNPDFQRGHVWSEEQQIAYVEYMLQEPTGGNILLFNHPNWGGSFENKDFVLVDGKQRLTAALQFVNNKLKAFGYYCNEYDDRIPLNVYFTMQVAKLQTKREVMKWYVQLNAGGTPHAKEEIERVKSMIETEGE